MESNIYTQVSELLITVREKISDIENKDNISEYDQENYYSILTELYNVERRLLRMLSAHKFLKVSKETFLNNETGTPKIREIYHTVTQFDTINSIAEKYNVSIPDILRINNITASDLAVGNRIRIVIKEDVINRIFDDIPVYGNVEGENILGLDIANDFAEGSDGDLLILEPKKTFEQGILNLLTTLQGDYPGEDIGFDINSLEDMPEELNQNLFIVWLQNMLDLDKRISEINDIKVTSFNNALQTQLTVRTIDNQEVEIK